MSRTVDYALFVAGSCGTAVIEQAAPFASKP